jgi:hypothetical protein
MVASQVPTLGTTMEVVSPMILNLKGEERPTLATLEGAEMAVSPVATLVEVLSPITLYLKGEDMPTHATTLPVEGSDSDAAACPISTNSLKPTEPTTNTG